MLLAGSGEEGGGIKANIEKVTIKDYCVELLGEITQVMESNQGCSLVIVVVVANLVRLGNI